MLYIIITINLVQIIGKNIYYVQSYFYYKAYETVESIPNSKFMRINTKSTKVFSIHETPYTKGGVGLLRTGDLARHTRMGGSS